MPTKESNTSEDLKKRIRQVLRSQTQSNVNVLSSLLVLEESFGYIPKEALEETAEFCGVSENEVWSVASFYTNFRFKPPGDNVLDVCWGPVCHIKGAQAILRAVQKEFDLEGEGNTKDGKLTLRYNTCLGACTQAPVVALNHKLQGKATPTKIIGTVRVLKEGN